MLLDPLDLSYGSGPWGSERLRKAMAKFMNKTFKPYEVIDADDILFSNGITGMAEMLGFTLGDPGDGVLFSRPIYQAFQVDFGYKALYVNLIVMTASAKGREG